MPLLAVLLIGTLGTLAYLATQRKSVPVVPSGGGGTGVIPVSVNEGFRLVSIDDFDKMVTDPPGVATAGDYLNDVEPPHQLAVGRNILLIVTNDKPKGSWLAIPARVTQADPNATVGYATAEVSAYVPGGPAQGSEFRLNTTNNENDAYLDPGSANIGGWLIRHGQGGTLGTAA